MNKLVSRNPVLRFKLGRKIVKAELGWKINPYTGRYINPDNGQTITPEEYKLYKLNKLRKAGYIDNNYIVKKNETLSTIARRNKMSLKELLKLNPNIKNPDRIDIGLKIKLKQNNSDPQAYLLRENNKREKVNLPTILSTAREKFIPEKILLKPKQKIKNKEYKVNTNKQLASIIPIASLFSKIFSSSKTPESYDSLNKNLQAIIDHKVRFNVNDPYIVVDKENNLMKIMQKDKVLEEHEITSSLNKGDGWFKLQGHKGLPKMPRTTGAGIFTVRGSLYSEYPRDKNTKEPMFRLYLGNENTTMAVHEPVNAKRRSLFNNKNKCDNRTSYGCISPKSGVIRHLFEDKVILNGDSLYVLPEIEGNYIHEKLGQLQTHYGENNPSTFITLSGFKGNFRYNNNK